MAKTKTVDGQSRPASDFLVVEDPDKPDTWHLPVKRNGKPDHGLMGAAWAALHGGYRGNKYQGPGKSAALSKLKALYRSEKMDLPSGEATVFDAGIAPREVEAEGAFAGREWDVTIIGADFVPDSIVAVKGREYLRSKNGRLYAVEALKASAEAWEGVKVYDNHQTDAEYQQRGNMRSVAREWIGTIVRPRWDDKSRQLKGVLKVVEESVARKLKNAWDAGVLKTIGLSIDTLVMDGDGATVEGKHYPTVEGFQKILSVDLVAEPAAGGGFNRLIAAQTSDQEVPEMDNDQIKELITSTLTELLPDAVAGALAAQRQEEAEQEPPEEQDGAQEAEQEPAEAEVDEEAEPEQKDDKEAEQPDVVDDRVRQLECAFILEKRLNRASLRPKTRALVEEMFSGRIFKEAELDKAITRAKEADADKDPSGRVQGAGGGKVEVGLNPDQKAEVEFARLLMGNTAFRNMEHVEEEFVSERVPEAYHDWIKAGRPNYGTRRISNWAYELLGGDPFLDSRAYEAITTSSMTSIIKNTVNLMLANDYAQRHRWWEPFVRTEEVDTIDDATLVRIYGLSTLSTVTEGSPYTELTWADEEETASFVKRGNYVGVTLEQLLSDKLQAIRTLPARLATSWYNTLSSLNSAVFTVNTATGPALADTGALFNATAVATATGHANLLTAALSETAYGAVRTAMMKQTDQPLGAGQKLLIRPRYVLVPVDLESTAKRIFNTEMLPGSANNDINPYYREAEVIVVPTWTDANDWAAIGDPAQFPAIWNIFLRGRRVPELFTAGDESSGAMFTNDTLRYKVRMLTYRFSSTYDCAPVSDFRPLHKSNVT